MKNMGFQKHHIPWNKDLTIIDPRVRKNIENRRVTVLQKYGTLYLGGRPKKGTIPWNRGLTKQTNSKIEAAAKKMNKYWQDNKRTPWNKGLTKQTDERVKDYGLKQQGKKLTVETKRKISIANKGKTRDSHVKQKMSQAKKGKKFSFEHKRNLSHSHKEVCSQPAFRKKQSQIHRTLWKNPFYREKIVKAVLKKVCVKPNKQEVLLGHILEDTIPMEYKYVGNGSLILGGRCPDFMNINGKKKLIELYGDYWHQGEKTQERIEYFRQFGFETLVIWEHELKDREHLIEKVVTFNREP